jgi:hypothetical protein
MANPGQLRKALFEEEEFYAEPPFKGHQGPGVGNLSSHGRAPTGLLWAPAPARSYAERLAATPWADTVAASHEVRKSHNLVPIIRLWSVCRALSIGSAIAMEAR